MSASISILHEIGRSLSFAAGMTWEILWALILGFTLSGVVQAVVSKQEIRRLMPDNSPKTLLISSGLGAASSACSYASVALARLHRRDGVRVRLHQPRLRTRDRDGPAARLAVCRRRQHLDSRLPVVSTARPRRYPPIAFWIRFAVAISWSRWSVVS